MITPSVSQIYMWGGLGQCTMLARVFRNSPLYQSAEHELLLRDSAYPLQKCILVFIYQYIIPVDFVFVFFVDKSIPYCIFEGLGARLT